MHRTGPTVLSLGVAARSFRLLRFFMCLAPLLGAGLARAESITFQEKNLEALNSALVMTNSMLEQAFEFDVTTLRYSGSFLDSGWTANLSGNYAGSPVSLTFTGVFDQTLQQGGFSSSGTAGGTAWSGSGTWSFTDTSPTSTSMSFSYNTLLPGLPRIVRLDRDGSGPTTKQELDDLVEVQDFGIYRWTRENGLVVPGKGMLRQESDTIEPKNPSGPTQVSYTLPDDGIFLRGGATFSTGLTSGSISTIPVPHISG